MPDDFDFSTWDDLAVRRQFWYLTQRIHYHNNDCTTGHLHKERNAILNEAVRRNFARPGVPFPKDECSDLID